jgi:hypothetical protein
VPERSLFAAVVTELPDRLPASPLREPPPLQVEIDVDRITLAGCRPGHPVLVRVSYHPRWRALTGERIWLAGPGLMLVYPRGERVDLVFGRGPVLATGGLATAAGLGIVLLSIMPIGRRLREWALARVGRVAAQAPLRRVVAGIRRSAEWPSKSRRRALWGGVGLVVMLLTLFAYVNASPDAATTYHQGQRLFDAGRLEEAIDLFRRAQERSPLSMTAIHARYFEAIAYYNMARWSEAEERFVALVEAFPEALNVPEGLWHVGLCRLEMGDPAGAIETWRKLVDGFPETRWAGFARQRLTALAVAEGGGRGEHGDPAPLESPNSVLVRGDRAAGAIDERRSADRPGARIVGRRAGARRGREHPAAFRAPRAGARRARSVVGVALRG